MHAPNTNLPHLHLQLIGFNSEEHSLTSVLQRIMNSEKLKYFSFGYPPFKFGLQISHNVLLYKYINCMVRSSFIAENEHRTC